MTSTASPHRYHSRSRPVSRATAALGACVLMRYDEEAAFGPASFTLRSRLAMRVGGCSTRNACTERPKWMRGHRDSADCLVGGCTKDTPLPRGRLLCTKRGHQPPSKLLTRRLGTPWKGKERKSFPQRSLQGWTLFRARERQDVLTAFIASPCYVAGCANLSATGNDEAHVYCLLRYPRLGSRPQPTRTSLAAGYMSRHGEKDVFLMVCLAAVEIGLGGPLESLLPVPHPGASSTT
uniref:Uncharacterized protein n=1 Tax=Mycena chlorophos TaxID=658473 RepID=A0ABQ0L323_MYCCL|nr:predicted protein [Mycena chlorophos]